MEREEAWIEAMRAADNGDDRIYEWLLGDIARVLRIVVRRRCAALRLSSAETEDIVQESLLGIHLKRHTWDRRRPILPWVHAIARHKLLDTARRMRRLQRLQIEAPIDDWVDVFTTGMTNADWRLVDVERQVAGLPRKQRSVVQALGLEGASIRAVAERLAMSEGAVRVTFHRGLVRLASQAGLEAPSRVKVQE